MRFKRRAERGFTLIELVVVLAILGVLLGLAIPRYLGSRRHAFVAEADNVLGELKSLAWGYYHEYGSWSGITAANMSSTFGFAEPPDAVGCWDYDLVADAIATQIQLPRDRRQHPREMFSGRHRDRDADGERRRFNGAIDCATVIVANR